jgi:broad specificity polyphosphatase/5'/3'-nucleotidase SurE
VLSVNYPARYASAGASVDGGEGAAVNLLTRAGRRDYPRAGVETAEWADGEVRKMWLFGEPDAIIPEVDDSLGTDVGALKAGHISVTPLSFALEISDLSPGFQSFLGRLTESFPLQNAMGSEA